MTDKNRTATGCCFETEREKKTVIYCRVAYADDFAIRTQENMLRNFATEKMISVSDVYSDNGASGANFDRPAFQKLMAAIEHSKVSCVIVKNISRISRNYLQVWKWLDDMRAQNVRVISVDDCYSNSQHTPLNNKLCEAVEKFYKESHSQRIKAGIIRSRQRKLEQSVKSSE